MQDIYSGVAIDGYLARATVFIDTNNDGERNPWEPFAFTDNDGYYSYNPLTETNYCLATASAEQAQYCLVTNTRHSNVVVRIDGGYDVITGEPFAGQLSRRVNKESERANLVISPITSLLTDIASDDQASVLSSLSLSHADLDINYLNTDGAGGIHAGLVNSAVKVHKVVTVLSDRLTDTYTEIGDNVGTPNDASAAVYRSLAQQLSISGTDFDHTINNSTALATVLDNAEQAMRDVYERKEFDLPADMGSTSNPEQFTRIIEVSRHVANVVNRVIDPQQTPSPAAILGQVRAVESVVIKALDEQGTDSSLDAAATFFSDSANQSHVDALLTALQSDSADIASLARHSFSGEDFASPETIAATVQLPQDAMPFTQIGGLTLKVSDLDLGSAPANLEDSEVEWYFHGDADDVAGSFSACVKHIDDANVDGTLGDGNTRGTLTEGYWSLMGARTDNVESYSLLITITLLGTTYQAILKPSGMETIGDVTYEKIRFDNDGKIRVWHSANGLMATDNDAVPTSNADCRQRLPSRVGL